MRGARACGALAAAGLAFAGLVGCGGPAAPTPAPTIGPTSGPTGGAPSRTDGASTARVLVGRAPELTVDVADSPAEWARGLMDRTSVAPDGGMLFVFPGPTEAPFHMFRTRVPLSIAFVRDDRVVAVREMTPCPADEPARCPLYPAGSPYTLAVEAAAGTFTRAGVRPGEPVRVLRG